MPLKTPYALKHINVARHQFVYQNTDPGFWHRCVHFYSMKSEPCTRNSVQLTWTSQEMDLSHYQLGSQGGSALKSKCSL